MARAMTVTLLAVALVAGCSSGDDGAGSADTTAGVANTDVEDTTGDEPEEAETETLRIVLANDDGIAHPGLDLMLRSLQELPDVEVSVVAPAENRSGSSDTTTPGGAPFAEGRTASGVEGYAVDGYPADAIAVALDELELDPHLVVSGINDAHNFGPFAALSGTVGVVRTAIRSGVPGVAASAGLEFNEDEFGVAAALVIDWITDHRDALLDGTQPADEAISFNVPTCASEQMGDLVEVPIATEFPEGVNPFESTCDLAVTDPKTDYEAVAAGYPAMTRVPPELPAAAP